MRHTFSGCRKEPRPAHSVNTTHDIPALTPDSCGRAWDEAAGMTQPQKSAPQSDVALALHRLVLQAIVLRVVGAALSPGTSLRTRNEEASCVCANFDCILGIAVLSPSSARHTPHRDWGSSRQSRVPESPRCQSAGLSHPPLQSQNSSPWRRLSSSARAAASCL